MAAYQLGTAPPVSTNLNVGTVKITVKSLPGQNHCQTVRLFDPRAELIQSGLGVLQMSEEAQGGNKTSNEGPLMAPQEAAGLDATKGETEERNLPTHVRHFLAAQAAANSPIPAIDDGDDEATDEEEENAVRDYLALLQEGVLCQFRWIESVLDGDEDEEEYDTTTPQQTNKKPASSG